MERTRILVVCAGNICRSPLGEGILKHVAGRRGIGHLIEVDSAGTGGWHRGDAPDPRSIAVAASHGIDISDQRARQVVGEDFTRFDLVLAMDHANMRDLARIAPPGPRAVIELFMQHAIARPDIVPDPYYGDRSDFEAVYAMLLVGAEAIIDRLAAGRSESGNTSSVR